VVEEARQRRLETTEAARTAFLNQRQLVVEEARQRRLETTGSGTIGLPQRATAGG